jgi:phage tail-like protein
VDVNRTRFHLIRSEREWIPPATATGTASAEGVEWAEGALRLRKLLPVFPPRREEAPPTIESRRGAARDRYGHWYWISDDGHEIRVSRGGSRPSTRFWSAEDAARDCPPPANGAFAPVAPAATAPLQLAGLAVTADHYLIAGRIAPNGIVIFDLRGGGAPLMLDWPSTVPFTPFDISAAADGGAWILDRVGRSLWRLDRFFRVIGPGAPAAPGPSAGFAPLSSDSAAECPPPAPIATGLSLFLAAVSAPIAVEGLPDGSVLVLDRPSGAPHSIVHRYRLDGTHFAVALEASLDVSAAAGGDTEGEAPPLPLVGHDFAFVIPPGARPRPLTGILYIVGDLGNQSFAFDFKSEEDAFSLALRREYLPMRRFSGKALVTAGYRAYFDFGERWMALAEHPNPRFVHRGTIRLPSASLDNAFDGREIRCVWHRLLIDGCIPHETTIEIETRSADRLDLLAGLPWQRQPRLYRRGNGAEIPYYRPTLSGDERHTGTWELLLQEVVGRFVQIRLTIDGTRRTTPRLQALRVHYPRFSYLKEYLPAVYRDDAASASFLDRYLANVEGTYTTLEGQIEQVETLLDTRSAPVEYLDWLAGWFGVSLDFTWREGTRRLFLAHAPQMFRERGTCAGLVRAIRLALDRCPSESIFDDVPCAGRAASGFGVRVVERFRLRRAPGVVLGDPTELLGPGSTTNLSDWTPARGAEPLHAQFRAFLRRRYNDDIGEVTAAWGSTFATFDDPSLRLPAVRPTGGRRSADWQRFVEAEIGFTYTAVGDADEPLYREFLARRYGQPSAVNDTYQLGGGSALTTFEDVKSRLWDAHLRQTLPDSGVWLRDWIQFVSIVAPMARAAHRFTVLVPVGLNDSLERQLERRELARRITDIEKPAHAAFDVRLYWGLFRVGEARVGLDTLIGQGSRSVALVLDRGLVGEGHLGFAEPWNAADRFIVGREAMSPRAIGETPCCCKSSEPGCGCGCGCGSQSSAASDGCGCKRG